MVSLPRGASRNASTRSADASGRPVRLVTIGAGESLGEGLLLDDSPHGTSARALQRTEVFVLRADQVIE